jgi:hypothetical protein
MAPLPEVPESRVTCLESGTPYCGYQRSGCVLSQVLRRSQSGLTGGEILPTHDHCGGVEDTDTDLFRV